MKLIHITPSYKPAYEYGGPTVSVARLCEELTNTGHNIEVLTTTANGSSELKVPTKRNINVDGVNVSYFNRIIKDHIHFSPSLLWRLHQTLSKKDQNIILHIHSWWNFTAIFSCLIAKYKIVPVILSPRGMITSYSLRNRNSLFKSLIHNIIGKKLISYCHIHATSTREKYDILKIAQPATVTIIPNFANLIIQDLHSQNTKKHMALLQTTKSKTPYFKLLSLSRIEQKKGLDVLFTALSLVRFPWKLTIAGTGRQSYIQALKNLASKLNISTSIQWIGQVKNEGKFKVFSNHDLLVLCAHNENFGNTIIESLSIGTPVAISDQIGLAPYILKNDLGWVSGLSPQAIAKMLTNAWQNERKRSAIKRKAPALIRTHFASSALQKQYINLYQTKIE